MMKMLLGISLLVASTLCGCGPKCVDCRLGACQLCHGYQLAGGICDLSKPAPKNCDIYGIFGENEYSSCWKAKIGFAVQKVQKGSVIVDGKISKCWREVYKAGKYTCYDCKGASPNDDDTICNKPLPQNCLIGSINYFDIQMCTQCVAGYASSNYGICKVSSVVGCMHFDEDIKACSMCDFENGYYFSKDGKKCEK